MQYTRFIGGIASRITALDKSGRPLPNSATSCWASSLSPFQVVVSCNKKVSHGQKLIIQLSGIGGFLAQVDRFVTDGFAMRLLLEEAARDKLSAKIAWHRKRAMHAAADKRSYRRWRPTNQHSEVLLANGTTVACLVLDVSASGAAVAATARPEIGMPLAVGQIVGKVVRHLDEGFAVRFLSVQEESAVERLLRPL